MTDEQFRQLRQMLLEQNVKIAGLEMTVRAMQRRMEELHAPAQNIAHIGDQTALESFLATYEKRSPPK